MRMKNLRSRLIAARKKAGLTQAEVAERSGMSQAAYQKLEGGKAERSRFLPDIARTLGVSVEALDEEVSYLEANGLSDLVQEPGRILRHHAPDKYALIPLHQVSAECGNGYHNDHEEVEGELAFRRDWLSSIGLKANNLRVIYATGDSMYPVILDGDVLLVDMSDKEFKNGRIYTLLRPDGSVSVKRMIQKMTGGWIISSDNPDKRQFPDEECDQTTLHSLPVIGRVVWRGGSGF